MNGTEQLFHTGLELVILESLWNEECPCEANYHDPTPCSIQVTHLFKGCEHNGHRICLAVAKDCFDFMENGDLCASCDRPCSVCWSVIPI